LPEPRIIRLFLSMVSDEFRAYRDQLRGDLTRRNVEVKVQDDFKDHGGATLENLDEYIKRCDAAVHLVGDMTGAFTQSPSTKAILAKYPDLPEELLPLGEALAQGVPISYTQWEGLARALPRQSAADRKGRRRRAARACLCADGDLPRSATGASCETSRR
jgi:hypothetical protein